ncbi:MAG: fimbrillin family protein [Bacteroides xylanisolvens]
MRKSLVMAAVATMVLAGCSQDDGLNSGVDQGNGTPIEFRTLTNKTRTTEMDKDNIGDFRVSAMKEGSSTFDVMENMAVLRTIGLDTWTYSPIKYYPNADKSIFFAYSPSGSVNVSSFGASAVDQAVIEYTVPLIETDTKKAEDFLVATTTVAKADYNRAATMSFKHALSMATFAAKNTSNAATFVISKIELIDLTNKGTLTADGATLTWATTGTQDLAYEASLPKAGVSILPGGTSAIAQGLTSANEGLMILPQDAKATTGVKVYFNAVDGEYENLFPINNSKVFTLPAGFKFEMGKKYAFEFTFDKLNEIEFDVEVGTWTLSPEDLTPVTP